MHSRNIIAAALAASLWFDEGQAEAAAESDVADLSLEELLNQKVGIATRTAVSTRESPAILTIVTREEIENSGARDLLDVLRLVPGFEFGVDVEGVVGAGLRGVWGHEGKILLLLDGQEMNENLYSTLQLGQHFLASTIDRVEIIRGPGSAIYGGYAELAVINVISRASHEASVLATAGKVTGTSTIDSALSLSAAKALLDGDLEVSLNAFGGGASRSGGYYHDLTGASAPMDRSSDLNPMLVNVGVRYRQIKARLLFDNYRVESIDGFGETLSRPATVSFPTVIADVQGDFNVGDVVTLTPRLNYKRAQPWYSDDPDLFYKKSTERLRASLTASADPLEGLNVIGGLDGYLDRADVLTDELIGAQTDFGGNPSVSYTNLALFAQALWRNPFVNVTAGARYEQHSAVGGSFVPRIGLTRVFDRLHVKALYSGAFRAPGIENINLGVNVLPERTWVAEAEVGYQFTDNVFARVNVFDVNIYRPIVYSYDPETDTEGYTNFPGTGTRGFEAELKTRFDKHYADATYSFYQTDARNEVPSYGVPGRDDLLLGLPQHKVTLNASYAVTDRVSINPSGALLIDRYGFLRGDENADPVLLRHRNTLLFNLFVNARDLGMKGLTAGVGVQNLLDSQSSYLQPYDGGHTPLSGAGRTFIARLGYTLPL